MKVKDRYWEAENSIRFANPEKVTRPLLCEPKVSEDGVRIRLWLRNLAEVSLTGGVLSLLFALSNVLQACIVRRPECPKPVVSVAFETHGDGADGTGHWERIGTLKADTVQNGVIPDRSNHQGRHEILRVESFDGDVKAVQSFLNEHDAGYIAEVTPEQPIIVEALGNKACVYVTKIVQCELGDILRLLETK